MTNNQFFITDKVFIFIYETKEAATKATASWAKAIAVANEPPLIWIEYWSKRLNSRVTFSTPNEPIFVIKKDEDYWHVIIGERVGWIVSRGPLGLKEINK